MTNDTLRELSVGLQGIKISESSKTTTPTSTQILKNLINLPIEPLISRIWLPKTVCEELERVLGLAWNDTASLYFITDKQHSAFIDRNITFAFTISDPLTPRQTTDIILAYEDLALTATPPLIDHTARYFPFQRAYEAKMIVLGRAFLQAAYMTADYDRRIVSISQANLDANSESRIRTFLPPVSATSPESKPPAPISSSSGISHSSLGPGPIAGIVTGVAICVAAFVVGLYLYRRRRRNRTTSTMFELDGDMQEHSKFPELASKGLGGECELEGSHGVSEISSIRAARELEGDTAPVELDTSEQELGRKHHKLENEHRRLEDVETDSATRLGQDVETEQLCENLVRHTAWTFPSTR